MTDLQALVLMNQIFQQFAQSVLDINARLGDMELSEVTLDASMRLLAITGELVKTNQLHQLGRNDITTN